MIPHLRNICPVTGEGLQQTFRKLHVFKLKASWNLSFLIVPIPTERLNRT